MNKMLLLAGVAATLMCANANASELKPYVGAKLKYVDMSNDLALGDTFDINDNVTGAAIALGVAMPTAKGAIRAELEYNNNEDAEKRHSFTDGLYIYNENFKVESQSLMVNAYYDFDTGTKLTPYVGGGIGYAKIKGSISHNGSIDDKNFAWQLGLGATYAIDDNVSLDAGYRHVDMGDFSEDEAKLDVEADELYVGARLSF